MAEDKDDSQEKTQDPTARRLEKAKEDGKVLSSKEVFVFTSMFMGVLLLYFSPLLLDDFLQYSSHHKLRRYPLGAKLLLFR